MSKVRDNRTPILAVESRLLPHANFVPALPETDDQRPVLTGLTRRVQTDTVPAAAKSPFFLPGSASVGTRLVCSAARQRYHVAVER